MRILRNQSVTKKLTDLVLKNEFSSITAALQTPTITATYFRIDADLSEVVHGMGNIANLIGEDSNMVFDMIYDFPMCGLSEGLLTQSEYDDETAGYEENYQSSAVTFPSVIMPKVGDLFIVNNSTLSNLYVVTNASYVTARSNPFVGINFRLYTRDQEKIDYLIAHQVNKKLRVSLSNIGNGQMLVLEDGELNNINDHINNYIEIANMYSMLFYDRNKAAFVFDGLIGGPDNFGPRNTYIDMTLWKFMFDNHIICYDDLYVYANSNLGKSYDIIYTSCPDLYITQHHYERSIINRIYAKNDTPAVKKVQFDHYRFPHIFEPTNRITKYQGVNIWYIDIYEKIPCKEDMFGDFFLWDDDFIHHLRQNIPYEEFPLNGSPCDRCEKHCIGAPVLCHNPYLRNAIINWFNDEEINWENIQVTESKTIENYYLIPIVLAMYKSYILSLT